MNACRVAVTALAFAGACWTAAAAADLCSPDWTMLDDPSGRLATGNVATIARDRFVPARSEAPLHPDGWYRLVVPKGSLPDHAFVLLPPGADQVKAYVPRDAMWTGIAVSASLPFAGPARNRGPPAFALADWLAGQTLYFNVRSRGLEHPLGCPRIAGAAALIAEYGDHSVLDIYFGLLGAIALYNLLVFVVDRDASLGYYVLYLTGLVFYQLVRNRFFWSAFWPGFEWHVDQIEFQAFVVTLALHAQFSRVFLRMRRYLPRLERWLVGVVVAMLAYYPVAQALQRAFHVNLDAGLLLVLCLFFAQAAIVLFAVILRVLAGDRPARYFLLSYPILFVFVGFSAVDWALGNSGFLGSYGAEIGTAGECLALSLAVGSRLRQEKRLHALVSGSPDIVVRLDRAGRIVDTGPNTGELLGLARNAIIGETAIRFVDEPDRAQVRKLVRSALRARRTQAVELRLQRLGRELGVFDVLARVDRGEATGRPRGLLVTLRDASARAEAREQLARASELEPSGGTIAAAAAPARISLFRGTLDRDGATERIGGRELELLAALALRADPVAGVVLADAIWPDDSERSALNALRITTTRLRTRLNARDAVSLVKTGYRLDPSLAVDARELQRAVSAGAAPWEPAHFQRLIDDVSRPLPDALMQKEWFGPYAATLERLRREFLIASGNAARKDGRERDAARLAETLMRLEPGDESGYFLAARISRAQQDEAALRRLARDCARALAAEHGVPPSAEFQAFVGLKFP